MFKRETFHSVASCLRQRRRSRRERRRDGSETTVDIHTGHPTGPLATDSLRQRQLLLPNRFVGSLRRGGASFAAAPTYCNRTHHAPGQLRRGIIRVHTHHGRRASHYDGV